MDTNAQRGRPRARGAHRKHVIRVLPACDAGRVETQRLVERKRVLPSRTGGLWGGKQHACIRGVGREMGGHMRGGPGGAAQAREYGWQGTRGAHPKHSIHFRDAGRVPAGYVHVELFNIPEEITHVGDD